MTEPGLFGKLREALRALRRLKSVEAELRRQEQELQGLSRLGRELPRLDRLEGEVARRLGRLEGEFERVGRLEGEFERLGPEMVRLRQLEGEVRELQALRKDVARLAPLEERLAALRRDFDATRPGSEAPFALRRASAPWLERARARLEDADGSRPAGDEGAFYTFFSEIAGDKRPVLHRQYDTYLPSLRAARSRRQVARVLDIGCGAGEFLAYLDREGIPACGVDLDASEAARARAAGLAVEHAAAADYLAGTAERFAAITLFQVIEHVPGADVRELLRACVDSLVPGGLLLVETVNLRHPLALNSFYTDPTHCSPLADNYLSFLFQWLGLVDVELIYTLPDREGCHADSPELHYYANYAVLGRAVSGS